jgi:tetratricopeptide (TPR) repeat protein
VDHVLRWLAPIILVVTTIVAFLPTLENGFVNFDDVENFLNNRSYRGLGPAHLRWMFITWNLGGLIPLTWMTLGLDYVVWGMDPAGYHLTSLALHVLGSLVFYFVLIRLLEAAQRSPEPDGAGLRLGALFGALLFAVHPLRVESVAWVTERRDVLSGLFFLLSILAYLRAWDTRAGERLGRKWYLLSLGMFLCALLSKAMAVTLPLVLLLLDVYPLRRLRLLSAGWLKPMARNILVEKAPFMVLSLACSAITVVAGRRNDGLASLDKLGLLDRISLAAHSAAFYLWKTIAPVNLAIMYELPERIDRTTWPFLLSWVVVISITAVCLVFRRRLAALPAVWVAYLATLAPVSGLVQAGWQMAADRYTYLPCLGWAALGGAGLFLTLRRASGPEGGSTRARSVIIWTAALMVIGLAALTWKQVGVWRDTETLWTHALAASPSGRAHENLGTLLEERGQVAGAAGHFEQLVRIRPRYGPGHLYLGAARAAQGRLPEAISHYNEAARLMPDSAVPHYNMGLALVAQNRTAEAVERYREAVKLVPTYVDAHNNLGLALAQQGRLEEAVQHFREALKLRPEAAGTHSNLGVVLARQGRAADALQQLGEAVQIDPGNAGYRNNLGAMLASIGRFDEAMAQFREALTLDPGLREAQVNLDDALARSARAAPRSR